VTYLLLLSASNRNDDKEQRVVVIADAGAEQRVSEDPQRRDEEPIVAAAPISLQETTAQPEHNTELNNIVPQQLPLPLLLQNLTKEPPLLLVATPQQHDKQPVPKTSKQRRKQANQFRRRTGLTKKPDKSPLPRAPSTVQKKGGKRRKESLHATYKLRNRQLAAAAMDIHIAAEPANY
jgi:hypothetical protein